MRLLNLISLTERFCDIRLWIILITESIPEAQSLHEQGIDNLFCTNRASDLFSDNQQYRQQRETIFVNCFVDLEACAT